MLLAYYCTKILGPVLTCRNNKFIHLIYVLLLLILLEVMKNEDSKNLKLEKNAKKINLI